MGQIRKPVISDNPVKGVITWNAQTGTAFYSNKSTGVIGRVSEFKGVIFEPSLYTAAGKRMSDGLRTYANICKYPEHTELKVRRSDTRELVAQGPWTSIKAGLELYKTQYLGLLAILAVKIVVEVIDNNGAPVGTKTVSDEIVYFKIKGLALIHSWKKLCDDLGRTSDDMDGIYIALDGTIQITDKNNRTHTLPKFKGRELDTKVEKEKLLLGKAITAYDEVMDYLKVRWNGTEETPAVIQAQAEAPAPVTDEADDDTDDDLPF